MHAAAELVAFVSNIMYDPAFQRRENTFVYVEVAVNPSTDEVATVRFIAARVAARIVEVVGVDDVAAAHWNAATPAPELPNMLLKPVHVTPASITIRSVESVFRIEVDVEVTDIGVIAIEALFAVRFVPPAIEATPRVCTENLGNRYPPAIATKTRTPTISFV